LGKKKGFSEGIYSSSVLSKPLLLKEKGTGLKIECVGRSVLSPFFFFHGIKRKTYSKKPSHLFYSHPFSIKKKKKWNTSFLPHFN